MGNQQYMPKKKNNIVPINMDAAFYYNRAMKSLNKLNYHKALRYFRKAIELEPRNPVNYCNMAGILAELGKYEESNRLIWHVLEEIDPELAECYFYLASNYTNLMDFEMAEQYLLKYCETLPEGEFVEEAEDLLEYICDQLQRSPREASSEEDLEVAVLHDRARKMLEEGRFVEASRLLQKLCKENPEFIAARNNLALCYYYMGHFEKAMETVEIVLKLEPYNIHALCNLAVFYSHNKNEEKLQEVLNLLKKIVPYHFDQTYKLATTLGILGENEAAYFLFRKMITHTGYGDIFLIHYGAVAAYNTGRLKEAEELWKKVKRLDPDKPVAPFYLNLLQARACGRLAMNEAFYHYEIPQAQKLLCDTYSKEEFNEEIKKNPLIRSSFLWALRFGDKDTKLQVIQAFENIADSEVEEALRLFLMNPSEDDYLKRVAIFVLRKMGVQEPLQAVISNKARQIDPGLHSTNLPVWMKKWQDVMDCINLHMHEQYDMFEQREAHHLWIEFVGAVYPNVPTIRKEEAWAASVEYLVAKRNHYPVTQEEVARRYGVSPATLARNCKTITRVCPEKNE
ncbi:tetratricopeptide repeat protein [Aneurinibacillus terranovensis]|uniref:tetratricopeptide repeat protein n=1 Tax=Aneurinibacillus terranovensis TaxID=278991 RepID=UPI000409EEA0|nr:tetratricopeptide repeat protein [Aneurinibacillus terranovensis]